jgi:hypothetical protein
MCFKKFNHFYKFNLVKNTFFFYICRMMKLCAVIDLRKVWYAKLYIFLQHVKQQHGVPEKHT